MNAYEQGIQAAFAGKELWMNPYAEAMQSRNNFHEWFSGWCCGKQQMDRVTQ